MRGHPYKLYPHYRRVDVRKYFFAGRAISIRNNLPANEAHFSNLAGFKNFIQNVDLTGFVSLGF
jgi:hypothetical protein